MIHVCEYLEPFDTINMSSTCKKLYLKMDEHLSNTKSSKDFKILKKNEDCIKVFTDAIENQNKFDILYGVSSDDIYKKES